MGNDKKKTPKTTLRKRVTASARARVSTTKRKQARSGQQEGSFLQQFYNDSVCNGLASTSNATGPLIQTQAVDSPNQEMLDLLRGLSESNKALTARMNKMEETLSNPQLSNARLQDHDCQSITTTLGHGPHQLNLRLANNIDPRAYQQPLSSTACIGACFLSFCPTIIRHYIIKRVLVKCNTQSKIRSCLI